MEETDSDSRYSDRGRGMTFPAPRQQITVDLFEHETGWSASSVDLKYSATAETLDEVRQMVWDHANFVYDDAQTRTIIWRMRTSS